MFRSHARLFMMGGYLSLLACGRDQARGSAPAPSAKTGAVVIHVPEKLTSIETGKKDGLDRPIRVGCVTCHATRGHTRSFPSSMSEFKEFHVGLVFQHGSLGCPSCHVPREGGEPRLHLADGSEIATSDAMRLCAQCHGPKYTTYLHGGHGGMSGYWDLSRGGRFRNHCVDCHDPHAPKYEGMHPVAAPRVRFLSEEAPAKGDPHG